MEETMAYSILAFYGVLAMITAAIGHYFDKANGFTYGYVAGNIISIFLWFAAGKKAAKL